MHKIILFYKFIPINDPETVMHWQRELCQANHLKGRIIISKDGINGTLGGPVEGLKAYKKAMNLHSKFKKIMYKWSDGSADDFPRLSIKVRDEIVTFMAKKELQVDKNGVVGGGKKLKPAQVHALIEKRKDVVFMDGRNELESKIGRFKNAIIPNTGTTRDFLNELEKPEMQKLKNKPIVTYCTGGIRCEILTTLMKNRGFEEVYQIDGGIAKYGEEFKDEGLWEGKMYVFDRRMTIAFSEKAKDIGLCIYCENKTSNFINCADKSCNDLVVVCEGCSTITTHCSKHTMSVHI
jgi:UPF0176 protein